MSHQKKSLDIKGMHCRSCEILLEKAIRAVSGVTRAEVDHKRGTADIEYVGELSMDAVRQVIENAGYALGRTDKRYFFSHTSSDYKELLISATVFLFLYFLIVKMGIFRLDLDVSATPGILGVLIIGLTAGVSTCMALVGGLVLGISSRHAKVHPEATVGQKFRPHIFFNLGRLLSYVVLGGFIGLVGSALQLSAGVVGILTLLLGFVMLFLGLKLIEIFPRLHNKNIVLPKRLCRFFGLHSEIKEYSHRGAFLTGALTFFVPCGFTQAMQLYAVSTGSFTEGALIMGVFALGTLPGIIGIGGVTSAIKGAFSRYFFKFAGLVVITLAIFNIVSGYRLAGLSNNLLGMFAAKGAVSSQATTITAENGKQIVEMTQGLRGYTPRQFTIKKGVPVIWKIRSTSQYTCAAYINMPAVGVSQPLFAGDNVIEFTPLKTGQLRFTCSMGMYTGSFTVVD